MYQGPHLFLEENQQHQCVLQLPQNEDMYGGPTKINLQISKKNPTCDVVTPMSAPSSNKVFTTSR